MTLAKIISEKFKKQFNETPLVVRSPGRVNMIGEHTDYNEGFVLPAAIDKEAIVAVSARDDNFCQIYSHNMEEAFEFSLSDFKKSEKGWPNYLMGVSEQLIKSEKELKGFNCVFGGNIPMGAGLSSSAALECALAFALNELFSLNLQNTDIVRLSQKAENEFVGVKCGIMDQFISVFGKKNSVLRLDCRSLEYQYYPFNFEHISILLFDTKVKHSLASSEYNTRRGQCEAGVKLLKKHIPDIRSLRDVSPNLLQEYRNEFIDEIYKRCEYVVKENQRLLDACEDLQKGDLESFGRRMYQSHAGLRDDYEVSCKELDFLVELVVNQPAVLGSRMMGGGFGGCTINLVKENGIEDVVEKVSSEYKVRFGVEPDIYIGKIEDGTSRII